MSTPPSAIDHPLFSGRTDPPPPPPAEPAKQPRRWKSFALMAGLPILLIGGSAAAYFGYIAPNKPANIWATALVNTGKGYDKLNQYVSNYKSSQATSVNGTFKLSGSVSADGQLSGSSDKDNGELTGSLSAAGLKLNLDIRTLKSTGTTPDVYFKVGGLDGLSSLLGGSDSPYASTLNSLNNQWYFVDHSFFDQFAGSVSPNTQVTSADISSIMTAVGNASKQYVFTSDSQKMVFTAQQNIGKEQQDGRSVYHYKVGVNKQHLKDYVAALCSGLKTSKLTKFFNNDAQTMQQTLGCATAPASIDKMDFSHGADAWVDLSTKLIHKVRFTDKTNQNNYFDIGQDYTGGNKFPFTIAFHSKDSGAMTSGSLQLTLDTSTNSVDIKGTGQQSGSPGENVDVELTIKPSTGGVKVDKPAGAKNILDLLNDLGISDLFGPGGTSGDSTSVSATGTSPVDVKARDVERKTDINALAGEIEAYYAQYGKYPTLAQINDPSWRAANMNGLTDDELKDPKGTSAKLVSSPTANAYSYQPTPTGCDDTSQGFDCVDYTLTATLEAGGTYVKQSANGNSF